MVVFEDKFQTENLFSQDFLAFINHSVRQKNLLYLTMNGQSPELAVWPLTIRPAKLSVLVQCVSDVSMTSVNVSNSLSTVAFVVVAKVVVVVVVAVPAHENPV